MSLTVTHGTMRAYNGYSTLPGCKLSPRPGRKALTPIFEDSCTFAEALWDHVTLDVDELAFRAGDVIEVTDMLDKDWWWGRIEDTEGWFPSTFVRLRVNQTDTADDIAVKMREGAIDTSTAMQQVTSGFISKDQARANVINEIITVERIYVKHLLDLIEGYVKHARKRPEMFSKDRIATIFGNLEQVYAFSYKFLQSLESHIVRDAPHKSEIGQCFLEFVQGFEIYSEYCNNHPYGLCELQMLRCDPKFTQFFEACRLLQGMNEIPLEGFLLTPVQKVCKYPLQLAELLKHSRPEHPDYKKTNQALEAMKGIASLINERKRRMESMEKIALWQTMVESWEGQDLLELSSELIHTGELHKYNLNTNGWVKDRVFFLFDHQLVYCKRDLLKRDGLTYKGRMVMDCSEITSVADGRDTQFNLTVKNAWKVFDRRRDKWFLLCAKTAEEKTKWLNAFRKERKRVKEDRHSGFAFSEQTKRIAQQSVKYRMQRTTETKVRKLSRGNINNVNQNTSTVIPPSSSLSRDSQSFSKKRPWAIFTGKKTAR